MTSLTLARLSLSRHRFATVITIISIGLSVACGGILLRLYQLSEARFSTIGQSIDTIVGAKAGGIEILLNSLNGEGDFPDFLPHKLFESLKADEKIQFEDGHSAQPAAIRSITPFVYFAKYDQFRVVGTDESFFQHKLFGDSTTMLKGSWLHEKDDVVLGSYVAQKNQIKVGDVIEVQPWVDKNTLIPKVELKVSGILTATGTQWDRTLFSTVEKAQEIFSNNISLVQKKSIWGPYVLHYFLINLNPNGFSSLEALINKRTVGQIIQVPEQKEKLQEITGVGKSVGLFVTVFVILLGGLAVCSMLVTRFEGMSVQLAVLRALGYTKKEISKWLLWEGLLLGLMGVCLGLIIDFLGFPILRNILGSALPPAELVSSSIFNSWLIWVIAIMATVTSVFIPMFRMSQQDTHNSLKGL